MNLLRIGLFFIVLPSLMSVGCASSNVEPIKTIHLTVEQEEKPAESKKPDGPKVIAEDGRFIAYENGSVKDTQTGLMWASKDNGKDITWSGAKAYCEAYNAAGFRDWRMPTQDELKCIYDSVKTNKFGYSVTELIGISACCPWPSDTLGSQAAVFSFSSGGSYWLSQTCSFNSRALPVRDDK